MEAKARMGYKVLPKAKNDYSAQKKRAEDLIKKNKNSEVVLLLKQMQKDHPSEAWAFEQHAFVALRRQKNYAETIQIAEAGLEIVPGSNLFKRYLAEALSHLRGEEQRAEKIFRELQKNTTGQEKVKALSIYGDFLLRKGRAKEAQEIYQSVLEIYERKLAELERKSLQQQAELEEAKKLSYLGMMATATAHELNQPVGVIRAAADAALADLEEGYFQEDDIKPLLERIFAQTDRLAAIIENFRKFARGDRTHREKVELNALVKRTIENFTEQFKHRNIVLKTEVWPKKPAPIAWANPYQLEEVLINLLANARDAVDGRENAVVWVKTWRRKGGGCGFSVEDNGPGLAPEYRQKMFTPFVSTKSTEKGTGLGLYISRRIIDELGGRLRYEDRPAGGARFIIDLPPLKG